MKRLFFPKRIIILPLLALGLFPLFPQEGAEAAEDQWEDELYFTEAEGLTVTGTLETSQEIKVIEKEEIERRNAPDLAALLQEALDLGVTRYGAYGNQADINMRGFDSERIAFLVNGVPANSAMDGEFDINQIGLQGIERIEVIYGGSDTKYNVSGALGGVINIITAKEQKKGLRFGGSVSNTAFLPGEYRNFNMEKESPHWEDLADTQNAALFGSVGAENFSLNLNGFFNRAGNHFLFKDTIFETTRRKINNEVYDGGASASAVLYLPQDAKLIAAADFYYGRKHIPTSGNSPINGIQADLSTRQSVMLDAPRAFHDDFETEASLVWHLARRDYEPPAGTASLHNQHSLSAINRWGWYPGEKLTLRSGIDYRFIHLDSSDMGIRSRHDAGLYLTAEYAPLKPLLIIPSVKVATNSQSVAPVPKLGLRWNVADFLTIKNNYFRSFKFPDFEELYWTSGGMGAIKTEGNPQLKPEDGWGGDIGIIWRHQKRLRAEGTFFTQWTVDSIHWASGPDGWKPYNVGEAMFFGLDSKMHYTFPFTLGPVEKIRAGLTYQYIKSYLLSYGYTWESDKRIPYMPEHMLGVSLDLDWGSGSALVSAHYETLRYADTANVSELVPCFLLALTVNQKIGGNLNVFAAARNITNASYESFKDYPMPGISLTLGIKAQFENQKQGGADE